MLLNMKLYPFRGIIILVLVNQRFSLCAKITRLIKGFKWYFEKKSQIHIFNVYFRKEIKRAVHIKS